MTSPTAKASDFLDQILGHVINKEYKQARELIERLRELDHVSSEQHKERMTAIWMSLPGEDTQEDGDLGRVRYYFLLQPYFNYGMWKKGTDQDRETLHGGTNWDDRTVTASGHATSSALPFGGPSFKTSFQPPTDPWIYEPFSA
jgi:hypothetical protein